MNVLTSAERAKILGCLVEGCSMRSTQRMTGAAKKTVERLLVAAGNACADYHDKTVRNLKTERVQVDEIWAFVGCKQRNVKPEHRDHGQRGDTWTWVCIDADSKLIVTWHTGGREAMDALLLMEDLKERLSDRVQLTTDGHKAYLSAVENVFGANVDFAQLVKLFEHKPSGKYSQPACIGIVKKPMLGNPDAEKISTSYVERQNLTLRMSSRRFTRLTNGFSKKLANHEHALAIHFMNYNFCRIHQTLRVTPAMAAGLTDHVWELPEVIALLDDSAQKAA